jgi:hypothetical protein
MVTLIKIFSFTLLVIAFGCSNPKKKNLSNVQEQSVNKQSKTFIDFKETPGFITSFLDSMGKEKFSIANPNEPWNAGCVRFDDKPYRQLISLTINEDSFIMEYWEGGFAKMKHIMRINFIGHKIKEFYLDSEKNPESI